MRFLIVIYTSRLVPDLVAPYFKIASFGLLSVISKHEFAASVAASINLS
jgi:hypothetical protein